MADRLALVFVFVLMPMAAVAQLSDVGVGVALYHLPILCCPPLAWATFGEGRWRLEVNYLQSFRETEGHAIYFLDDVDGGSSSVQRANLFIESQHHASGLVLWRALGRSPGDSSLSILFGGAYVHSKQAGCFASEGPVLSPEERSRCADSSRNYHHRILPQVGAALDVPVGERFFLRATMRLFISLAEVGCSFP